MAFVTPGERPCRRPHAGAAAGHTKLTRKVFFINGCDTRKRTFTARTFAITAEPLDVPRKHLKRAP